MVDRVLLVVVMISVHGASHSCSSLLVRATPYNSSTTSSQISSQRTGRYQARRVASVSIISISPTLHIQLLATPRDSSFGKASIRLLASTQPIQQLRASPLFSSTKSQLRRSFDQFVLIDFFFSSPLPSHPSLDVDIEGNAFRKRIIHRSKSSNHILLSKSHQISVIQVDRYRQDGKSHSREYSGDF